MKDTRQEKATSPTAATSTWSPSLIDLYADRFDQLVRSAQQVVCDRTLAEECVQEAFVSYHVKGVTPRPGAELAYLRTMVRNGAISMVRAEQRGRDVANRLPVPCSAPSPEAIVLAHLAAADLSTQVSQLAPRQAEVIELRLAGMSVSQTAQHLKVTSGTVKTHRHRAAEALQPCQPEFGQAFAA